MQILISLVSYVLTAGSLVPSAFLREQTLAFKGSGRDFAGMVDIFVLVKGKIVGKKNPEVSFHSQFLC